MSLLERDPPHISDPKNQGEESNIGLWEAGDEQETPDWLTLAREAYSFSTTYVDSNYRKRWEDSIRAFNNQHAQDSKYVQPAYDKRSKVFRPKTRAVIRKNEAAAAAAFFSNMDVVSCEATNQSNPQERISADIMKELLNYRFTKTIPWFQTLLGALQDAQKTGVTIGRVYWEYEEIGSSVIDRPRVDLIPIENFRFDPAASWIDPIGTSPYIIHLIPMHVGDIRERMEKKDPKTGRAVWKKASDGLIRAATQTMPDSTRIVRERNREDPTDTENRPISDYAVAWIQRHIHRRNGQDWEFYTLSDQFLLTDPQPLVKSTWHGQRDYVCGTAIIEAHTSMPASVAELGKQLQEEINEVANQRIDNVKFVMNKRWFAKRGKNVDLASLVRNVPGGITMMDDVEDVKEVTWPDVTQSAYAEQDRLNADMDELLGNFSTGSLTTNPQITNNAPVRSMQMLGGSANALVEYLIRTFVETWVQPVINLLVKCEQKYESDLTILAIAADRSKMMQKYGINQITDEMLNSELTIRVNVGMGATDPQTKLAKFITGVQSYVNIVKAQVPGLNINEIGKEIFGHLGYQDGSRFMSSQDPQAQQMQMQMQQMQQMIMGLQKQLSDKNAELQTKVKVAQIGAQAKIGVKAMEQGQAAEQNKREVAKIVLDHSLKQDQMAGNFLMNAMRPQGRVQ